MAMQSCPAGPRIHWGRLRVQVGDRSFPTTVTGPARLIALYHFRRGRALPGVWMIENAPVPVPARRLLAEATLVARTWTWTYASS